MSVPVSGDRYETLLESGYRDPILSPLSTFALDVDTASYSLLRRFLNDGNLPPSEAVRIEELLNYFDYPATLATGGEQLSITTEVIAAPWNPTNKLAMVQLRAAMRETERPNRFVFLIDTSGSMQGGDRLPLLKKAFMGLVEQMSAADRIAIVTYAGSAGVALASTSGGDKNTILRSLQSLRSGGSTAGGAGIEQAYQLARQQFSPDANNRVILATDGDFNVGPRSSDALIKLIESQRDGGIFLTVLGFGQGNLGDGPMNRLAQHGDGNYFYIDSELEARRVLVEKLQQSLMTVAKDVKLQVEFNPGTVGQYRLLGYETRRMAAEDFRDDTKDAGDVGAGQVVTALYEIVSKAGEQQTGSDLRYQQRALVDPSRNELMAVHLRYRAPQGGPAKELSTIVDDRLSERPSANVQWAAAVAEFGLLLSDSKYRAEAAYASVIERAAQLAAQSTGAAGERKREFVSLARLASLLKAPGGSPRHSDLAVGERAATHKIGGG
ncbi:von Willebrand factor type A domain-containing protein [Spongiibacter taiwanensis]|uniref:vWA domain-containing protein n=1 Tax=Spongiibacter taiwanensis TaxID=1748242 RepID=UPI0020360903|nr:von Willebrand factor type A domain-containing protein [Spongiibacter taiwanensis]USA43952.1 von Willebrand factor type A domain-containing protein [Spongiibacter taiwanensis]